MALGAAPLAALSPTGLILGLLALVALLLGARRRLRPLLSAGILLVGLCAAEFALYRAGAPGTCAHRGDERPGAEGPFDADLGYGPVPGQLATAEDIGGGGGGYEGVYTIDERGLRATPQSAGDEAVLFFGGSYTFGLGVSDADTMAWQVGEQLGARGRAHNFGYGGYGTQQMLSMLESGRVEQLVAGRVTWVVYQLIPNHIRRVVGRASWDPHGPRYLLEDGRAVRAGRFCDPPLGSALARSGLATEFRRRVLGAEIELCAAMTAAARDEVARRFPDAHFLVLLWDDPDRKSATLIAELRERGVEVELVSDILPGWADEQLSAWNSDLDHHPSPRSHAVLAEHVWARIQAAVGTPQQGR